VGLSPSYTALLFSLIFGVFIYLASFVMLFVADLALESSSRPWFILVASGAAWLFYVCRVYARWLYALLEIAVGVASILSAVQGTASSDLARLMAVFGGTYVIVRGLDNFENGMGQLKKILPNNLGMRVETMWQMLFRLGLPRGQ
jgi:hypothetical protein